MCSICGQPDFIRCNCVSNDSFCDQCANESICIDKMDSGCVIYHFSLPGQIPPPTRLINLGMPNGSSAEAIFEKIDTLVGSQFNIPITPVQSNSIELIVSGAADHTLEANLRVSPQPGNQVVILSDGVFAPAFNPDYKVKVSAADIPRYLEDSVVGGTDGCVNLSITRDVDSGLLLFQPNLDIVCLINRIKNDFLEEFCDLQDSCKCFVGITDPTKTYAPACPTGYTYNPDTNLCEEQLEQPATITGSPITAQAVMNNAWSNFGGYVYNTGFQQNGTGNGSTLQADVTAGNVAQLSTAVVWANSSVNTNDGPMNRSAVWSSADPQATGPFGFTVAIQINTPKTYYIGTGADNDFQIYLDGNTTPIIDTTLNSVAYDAYYSNPFAGQGIAIKFKIWHVYPITLSAGVHYITINGTNQPSTDGGFGVEIYDNTLAELQAATLIPGFDNTTTPININYYSNLNLLFSTRCARSGAAFNTGNATCPDNTWTLDTTGGTTLTGPCQGIGVSPSAWVCRKTLTQPFNGYSVLLVWNRLTQAITYDVQQKLSTDPDSSYVTSVGSPVTNPSSGSTVSLTINNLPSNDMTFRIRPNYGDCVGPWMTV